jgi:hypothetical protein
MALMRMLAGCLLFQTAAIVAATQTPNAGIAGGGVLSPSVVASYQGSGHMPTGPLTVDLLVLWRGSPGWFDERTSIVGGGGSDGVHVVKVAARALEIQFDSRARTVQVQGQVVALQQNNVLLLDEVDSAGGANVAGVLRVDATIWPSAGGGQNVDPIEAMLRQAPELVKYLRCDARFANMNDPFAEGQLRNCGRFLAPRRLF